MAVSVKRSFLVSGLIALAFSAAKPSFADDLNYQVPPKPIADLVNVPPTPSARLSPDRKTVLLLEQPTLPGIVEVSQPELKLAGLRVNPKNTGPSRNYGIARLYLRSLVDENAKPMPVTGIPEGARISDTGWSPDGSKIAFTVTSETGITLWIIDPATAHATRLSDSRLNGAYYWQSPYEWVSDGTIIARLIPADRGAEPVNNTVPTGPVVQENDGQKRPARTQPDLLKNPHDELLFDYYLRSQLARIHLDGKTELIGKPDLYKGFDPSPDGRHILVETLHHPYSYKVGLERFPYRVEILSLDGKPEIQLADLPLAEEVPIDFAAVPTGRRNFDWRDDADATVYWVEALDGGDPKKEAAIRDVVYQSAAPYTAAPKKLIELPLRFSGITWGTGKLALVKEWWWTNRKTRTYIVAPDDDFVADAKPQILFDRSSEDRYSDPGRAALDATPRGTTVMHQTESGDLLLLGEGASPEGDRPFVDDLDLKTLKTKRLWRSEAPSYEFVAGILDRNGNRLFTRHETTTEQPQYFVRTLADGKTTAKQLTDFPNPNPGLASVQKKLIQYQRADGVKLSGMLYLPPDFKTGESKPVPLLMWAYPSEFKSKEAAGQVKDSPYRFIRAAYSGPLFALLMGFAVLDDPEFPIVGEGKVEPNDTYVPQLIAGAEAAVNEVVRLGVADRDRLAIGGHSYGAFTTANLLAHTDLFRAGIARSGAYNRTLTPFGFQSEERNFWQAKRVYIDMSPFTFADKIDEPLLMIHGEVDDNPGTYPIQSERFFEALKGLGGRTRLVILPAETHGYRARESVLHTLWEMNRWLDKNVKNAGPRK